MTSIKVDASYHSTGSFRAGSNGTIYYILAN